MIDRPDDETWSMLLILIAAISGAIGGCGGAVHVFLTKNRSIRLMQAAAYSFLGLLMAVLAFGLLSLFNEVYQFDIKWPLEALVGFSLLFGFGGSLLLSGTNILIHWTTKHFGKWEIKFTARQNKTDRRNKKKNDDHP